MMSSKEICKISGIKKRSVLYNYSMLAPYSIVFTTHSSLQKLAMHTKKSVCIVAYIIYNRIHTTTPHMFFFQSGSSVLILFK